LPDPPHPWRALGDHGFEQARFAGLLRSTRKEVFLSRCIDFRKDQKKKQVKDAEKVALNAKLEATTLFDVFWRLRTRANYADADVFVLGANDESEARRFAQGLFDVTESTVLVIEALIAKHCGKQWPGLLRSAHQRPRNSDTLAMHLAAFELPLTAPTRMSTPPVDWRTPVGSTP
jgi:hypothetical protein